MRHACIFSLAGLMHVVNICLFLFLTDDILQLENSPLRAADITTDLKKQFAFLSGKTFIIFAHLLYFNLYYLMIANFTSAYLLSVIICVVLYYITSLHICMVHENSFLMTEMICYSNVASVLLPLHYLSGFAQNKMIDNLCFIVFI